ncbi:hypothetical protein DL769_003878 [Monosporascus sp. CRB-8-3]|nr:hypothetical protein DL769_003878 [Monosporascus sp. CRB-8-3]
MTKGGLGRSYHQYYNDVIYPFSLAPSLSTGTINSRARAELEKRIPDPQKPEPRLVHGDEPPPVRGEYAQQDVADAVVLHLGGGRRGLDVGQEERGREPPGEHVRHPAHRSQARIARRRRALDPLGGGRLMATLHRGAGGLTFASFPIRSIPQRPARVSPTFPERAEGRRAGALPAEIAKAKIIDKDNAHMKQKNCS